MTASRIPSRRLLAAFLIALATAACRSPGSEESELGDSDVVTCTRCRTVWVSASDISYTYPGPSPDAEPIHQCPDCSYAVENYFATGKWAHSCKICGEGLQRCEARRP